MKKLMTGTLVFSIALGFLVGATLIPSEQTSAAGPQPPPECVLELEPFYWVSPTDPDDLCEGDPLPGEVWLPAFICEGYLSTTGQPCQCTFIGCGQVVRPTGKTPNHQ